MKATNGEAEAHAAGALRELAQEHKKAMRYHRKALRDCMEKLRAICEAHNIKLSIKGEGGNHGPQNATRTDDGRAH